MGVGVVKKLGNECLIVPIALVGDLRLLRNRSIGPRINQLQ